jgi:drug/metabolite transporter (DMT)-like permease
VVLVVQPEFMFAEKEFSPKLDGKHAMFIGLMLLVSLFHGVNMHFIHHLAKRIHPFLNIYYYHLGLLLSNGILCNLYPKTVPPDAVDLKLLLGLAGMVATGIVAQYGITLANSINKPSTVPFGYLSVMVGFSADILLFGVEFNMLQVVGMLLASSGLLSGFFYEQKEKEERGSVVSDAKIEAPP